MKTIIFSLLLVLTFTNIAFAQDQTVKCISDKFPQNTGSDIVLQFWKNKLTGFVTLYLHGETDILKKNWASYNPGETKYMQYGKTVNYLDWAGGWPGSPRYVQLYDLFYDGIEPLKRIHLGVPERKYSGDTWYNNEIIYTYTCN